MPRSRLIASLGLLMIAALVLAACGQPPQAPQSSVATATQSDTAPGAATSAAPSAATTTEEDAAPVTEATEAATEEPTTASDAQPTAPATASGPPYRVGIFEDLTTVNYWSYLGPNSSV